MTSEAAVLVKKPDAVATWLKKLEPDCHPKHLNILKRYLAYRASRGLSSDPNEVAEEAAEGGASVRKAHLQAVEDWLNSLEGPSSESKGAYYKSVRSFYRHNWADLPRGIVTFKKQGQEAVEVSQEPTAAEFIRMTERVLVSGGLSVRDRSIVLTKCQGFMDNVVLCKVYNYVGFPQLAKHFGSEDWHLWDEKKVPVRVDLVRRKNGYQHYTFLDRDAIVGTKEWLDVRASRFGPMRVYPSPNPKYLPRSDPIYVTWGPESPVRPVYVPVIFARAGFRAGVNSRPFGEASLGARYPFHGHEFRDTAKTLARSVGVDPEVVDFFLGHDIDKLHYDKSPKNDPEFFREQYSKLAPYLNVVSGKVELATREARKESERLRVLESQRTQKDLDELRGQMDRIIELLQAGAKVDPRLLQVVVRER